MVKINQLEIENVKRIKAFKMEPAQNGLTVIGGKNGQGKTSVLDSIAWALGGDRYRPSQPQREGSVIPPMLHIELSNGLIVERKGKNSDLKVTDPDGKKGGQQLLNDFISQLALDLPKFLNASAKEKADILLKIIGVGDTLTKLEKEESSLYNQRHAIGQIADRKEKYAKELPRYDEAPSELISIKSLIEQQQSILAKNGENNRLRIKRDELAREKERLETEIERLNRLYKGVCADYDNALKSAEDLQDESTEEIERSIAEIEQINIKVRANLDREKAEEEAKGCRNEYNELSVQIENIRKERRKLLEGADLPLDGLFVEDGELTYRGFKWDNMSGAQQLKVGTAIVRRLNPECGFVLLDKLEQMDPDTLREFGEWLENEGLQAIATRVSTGEECSIIIEDGYEAVKQASWQKGVF
ncbi:MAG: AAA family ATPase [Clostridiales bacterium]|nr:AAA family ATPase [Clostridiales bacterium]